jgi:hypothetical protein
MSGSWLGQGVQRSLECLMVPNCIHTLNNGGVSRDTEVHLRAPNAKAETTKQQNKVALAYSQESTINMHKITLILIHD